jgi:nicotinamide-nucleotide amidase
MTTTVTVTDRDLGALAERLGAALRARGWTFAAAESCTGGWIAKATTDIPGSSAWFVAGYVVYSNDAKVRMLGVPPETIAVHGAVSEAVVVALADHARREAGADVAVAVSGVAGPGGGTPEKPVGTVWFAWSSPDGTRAERRHFDGDRDSVRRQSVAFALRELIAIAAPAARDGAT